MEDYSIELVTSMDDVYAVATVFMKAAQHRDTFWKMKDRYGSGSQFKELLETLEGSVEHPNQHVFKAVHKPSGEVVGMAQWKAPWYLEVEKVDPFAQNSESEVTKDPNVAPLPPTLQEPEDPAKIAGFEAFNESRRQIGNAYVTHIRGKKHVFLGRLGVHPEHQRRGIASRLMQWGTDFADAHGLVAFLNGRPEAIKLYESFGYKTVQVTHFKFADLEVAPIKTMLRLPVPEKKVDQ